MKSLNRTLVTLILILSLNVCFSTLLNPDISVHAQGSFEYTLSNSGNVTLAPGNSGSTTVIATLSGGTTQNVTLSCDPSTLPTGVTCVFSPAVILPAREGNVSVVTVTVPSSTSYSTFNVTVTGTPFTVVPTTFSVVVGAKIAINPTAIASTSYAVGAIINVEVNITDAVPFSGFIIALSFKPYFSHVPPVLSFQSLDFTGGVLGNDAAVSSECVNGGGPQCIPDLTFDDQNVVSLSLITSSGGNTTVLNGKLFTATFTILRAGFLSLHFAHAEVQSSCTRPGECPVGVNFVHLNSAAYDGYFTNQNCGTANLCKPPVISFSAPSKLVTGRNEIFRAFGRSQNPNGNITIYGWGWRTGLSVRYANSTPGIGPNSPTQLAIAFPATGENDVTIWAVDNYNTTGYSALSVQVIKIWTDLGIASVSVDHTAGVTPGTTVHVLAKAINNGVNPVNSTFRLSINSQNLTTSTINNLAPALEASMSYNWTTTNLTPRVYRLEVRVDEVVNATTGQVLENDTSIVKGKFFDANNVDVLYVQLISAVPGGFGLFLGLNLPETLGVGIILVAVVVFAAGLVRKARTHPEPL